MRTLLTGATGYLGAHVLAALVADGHDVTALVRDPARLGPFAVHPRVRAHRVDLEDAAETAAALPGHDACVHAALVWDTPERDLELRDVVVTAKLFEAAGAAGVRRAVLVSSAAVHRPFAPTMRADDALAPADVYGATKAAGELFLRAACATHGMVGVVVRPGPIVGPPAFPGGALRTDRRIAALVEAARAGHPLPVPRGAGRQLSDVAAVARAVARLVAHPDPMPTYLCMDRAATPWVDVARAALVAVGARGAGIPDAATVLAGSEPLERSPCFVVDRFEALLGGPTDARAALLEHLAVLLTRGP